MKKITKDNKGITLIALVITVMLLVIIGSVSIYTGLDTYRYSKVSKFVTQMQLLQAKVDDLVVSKTTEELNNMGLQAPTSEQQNVINTAFNNGEISTNDINKYKVFTKDKVLELLDVEDVQNDIMVNFETREIISSAGIEYEDETYYTQYLLPGGQTLINKTAEPSRSLGCAISPSIDGLNATMTIEDISITNVTLSYKEENDNYWQTITNYTETNKSYDVLISKSGNYIFKLQDNTKSENSIEKTVIIKLTNKPRTETEIQPYNYALGSGYWAYAQKNDVNYVWIPRFAYDTNNNIKFIKGNSNIATDNTYIDNTWSVHSKFEIPEGALLTGIWVEVSEGTGTISGLDMLTLLNDSTRTTLIEI